MNNKQQFIITVRFPEWQQSPIKEAGQTKPMKFPAFGVRYLYTTTILPYPDWDTDDERWFDYDEHSIIKERFIKMYEKNIKPEFDGEILFIEPTDLVTIGLR